MENLILKFLGTSAGSGILTAVLAFLTSMILLRFFRRYLLGYMEKVSEKTKTDVDDLIIKILKGIPIALYLFVSIYVAINFVTLPPIIADALGYAIIIVTVYYVIQASHTAINYLRDKIIEKRREEDPKEDVSIIKLLANITKYSMWFFGVLLILANMGIEISALVAGMGVGGIAIALALQNILGDIFSSFSVYFDKPYKVGDFIIIGDDLGEVTKIGIKSTRIKTLRGEELIVSNKEMTSIRIHNFGNMPHRRVVLEFGVTYNTPVEKLKKIPKAVKEIIEAQELVRFDRTHFKEFGDFSLNFEVVYILDTPDYNKYMDTQQTINLAIMEAFEKEGIEFAYPTQTLYLKKISDASTTSYH